MGMIRIIGPEGEVQYTGEHNLKGYLDQGWQIDPGQRVAQQLPGREGTFSISGADYERELRGMGPGAAYMPDPRQIEEQRYERQLEEEYSGLGYDVAAVGAGAARTLTFGGSDYLLRGLGVDQETLRNIRRTSPYASLTGEIGGILAASFLGGAGGMLTTTPAGAVSTGLANVGARGTGAYIGAQVVEGAVYGLGHSISQIALGETQLAGESVWSELGTGLVYGALGGAVAGGGVTAGRKIWGKLAGQADTPLAQFVDDADMHQAVGQQVKTVDEGLEGLERKLSGDITHSADELATMNTMGRHIDDVHNRVVNAYAHEAKQAGVLAGSPLDEAVDIGDDITAAAGVLKGEADYILANAPFNSTKARVTARTQLTAARREADKVLRHKTANSADQLAALETYNLKLVSVGEDLGIPVSERLAANKQLSSVFDKATAAEKYTARMKAAEAKIAELDEAYKAYAKAGKIDDGLPTRLTKGSTLQSEARTKAMQTYVRRLSRATDELGWVDDTRGMADTLDDLYFDTIAYRARVKPPALPGGAEVTQARATLKNAFGRMDAQGVAKFLRKKPEDVLNLHRELTEQFTTVNELAKANGAVDLVESMQKTYDDFSELVLRSLPDGAEQLKTLSLKELAAAVGIVYTPSIEGPYDDLAKVAIIAQILSGGKAGRVSKSWLNRILTSGTARGASYAAGGLVGRAASKGGVGFVGRDLLQGMARGPAYDVVHSIGNRAAAGSEAARATGRVTQTIDTAVKGMAKGARPFASGRFSAIAVLNSVSFSEEAVRTKQRHQDLNKAYTARVEELQRLAANPQALAMVAHEMATPFREANVDLGDRVAGAILRNTALLAQEIPRDPGVMQRLGQSRWQADSVKQREFARALNIYANPMDLIKRLPNGVITPSEARLWKAMWPSMFQKLQASVIANLPDIQKNSTYDQRIRWSVFFEMPVDSVMRPEFRTFIQQQYVERAAEMQPNPPKSGAIAPEPKTRSEQLDARRQGIK